ncbi:hypothetical protein B0A55_10561, partial [Friedmanniomyces simplex]
FIPGKSNTVLLATPRPKHLDAQSDPDDLHGVTEYDYIIVGGGTAGCVLASRLSEDAGVTVLVVEAGQSDLTHLMSRIPVGNGQLLNSRVANWDYETESEAQMNGRKIYINLLVYNRGSPDDFEEWQRLGNEDRILVHYQDVQSFRTTLLHHHAGREGGDSEWLASFSNTLFPVDSCAAIGIRKTSDLNCSTGTIGATIFQRFIDRKGHRSSAATAYITSDVARRPNLKIAVGQTVTKLIFDTSGKHPQASGVILSAGATVSPQSLMLSGIRLAAELRKHNIPVICDLPGVGANVADHLTAPMVLKSKMKSMQYLFSPVKSLPALFEWLRFGTGATTTTVVEAACFLRSADRPDAPEELKRNNATSGKASPDLEIPFAPLSFLDHGAAQAPVDQDWGTLAPCLLGPTSRGRITLADTSPFSFPRIKANYLSTKNDRDLIAYDIRVRIDIVRAPPLRDIFDGWWAPSFDIAKNATDEQLLEHVRKNGQTIHHAMCSAKMGPKTGGMSVVDDRCRVHGVRGLRVVDAGIFPTLVACHPCAVVVSMAEKAADVIKEDRRSKAGV